MKKRFSRRRRVPLTERTLRQIPKQMVSQKYSVVHKTVIIGTLNPSASATPVGFNVEISNLLNPDGSGFTSNGVAFPAATYKNYLVHSGKISIQFMNSINTGGSSFPVVAFIQAYSDRTPPGSTTITNVCAGIPHTRWRVLNQTSPTRLALATSVKRMQNVKDLWDEQSFYQGTATNPSLPASPYRTFIVVGVNSLDITLDPPQVPYIITLWQKATWFNFDNAINSRYDATP